MSKRIKPRNPFAVAARLRSGAGKHANKGRRGSGEGQGRRHPKHKGRAREQE